MDATDRDLLEKARQGDERAIDALLSLHEKSVYRFGLRMCGSEEQAKEVLQETLFAAFKDLHHFRGEASLSTWLFQIARSFCMKAQRRRVDEPSAFTPLEAPQAQAVASSQQSPEVAAHAREVGEAIQAAMLALSATSREVLILRDVEGLSAEETAEVLKLDVGAVKSRLHRARLELRRRLGDLLEPESAQGEGCAELVAELLDEAAKDIDQAACVRIDQHLASCPRCSGACESLKRTVSLCRSIPGEEVPRPVRSAVRQALLQLTR